MFGGSHLNAVPEHVVVRFGTQTVVTEAQAKRVGRGGRQILVRVNGRLVWVASHRVSVIDRPAAE